MVPPLTDELVEAQNAGRPFAAMIVRDYTELLYAATEGAVGPRDTQQPGRHSLLAPAGRIASLEDANQPAVPLLEAFTGRPPFNEYALADGIDPRIHVPAAARALSGLGSANEVGGPAELVETLDRAWFLLAFSLNVSLGNGQMFDSDRNLIVDLLGGCTRLHELSGPAEPPAFVRDAADRDLTLRHFVYEWVTSNQYATTDGQIVNEGRPSSWDSGVRFPVGALLRERFGGSAVISADAATAISIARGKVASNDFAGARAAVESAVSDSTYSRQANDLLRELVAEHACRELIAIHVQYETGKGTAARQRVEAIGRELLELGGMRLMREVHATVNTRRRDLSRALDMNWDGIGSWEG